MYSKRITQKKENMQKEKQERNIIFVSKNHKKEFKFKDGFELSQWLARNRPDILKKVEID
jgi:hypothetical protein